MERWDGHARGQCSDLRPAVLEHRHGGSGCDDGAEHRGQRGGRRGSGGHGASLAAYGVVAGDRQRQRLFENLDGRLCHGGSAWEQAVRQETTKYGSRHQGSQRQAPVQAHGARVRELLKSQLRRAVRPRCRLVAAARRRIELDRVVVGYALPRPGKAPSILEVS
jgi:hypothetical protein